MKPRYRRISAARLAEVNRRYEAWLSQRSQLDAFALLAEARAYLESATITLKVMR